MCSFDSCVQGTVAIVDAFHTTQSEPQVFLFPRCTNEGTKKNSLSLFWAARQLVSIARQNRVAAAPVEGSEDGSMAAFLGFRSKSGSFGTHSFSSNVLPRRSSMRGSAAGKRMRRKKKRVRFMGVASPYTASFISLLVHVFRSGSPAASSWEFVVACGSVADLIFIPLSILGQMFHHHQPSWRTSFNEDIAAQLSHKFLVFKNIEVWMDALFVADLFYKLSRAMVRDLGAFLPVCKLHETCCKILCILVCVHCAIVYAGYNDSPVDRLVNAAPTEAPVQQVGHKKETQTLAVDIESKDESPGRLRIGKAVRWQLLVECPLRILLMAMEWVVLLTQALNVRVHIAVKIVSALARTYRLGDLWGYFTTCQEDVATDVRWVAFFKFAFIIFITVCSIPLSPAMNVSSCIPCRLCSM